MGLTIWLRGLAMLQPTSAYEAGDDLSPLPRNCFFKYIESERPASNRHILDSKSSRRPLVTTL